MSDTVLRSWVPACIASPLSMAARAAFNACRSRLRYSRFCARDLHVLTMRLERRFVIRHPSESFPVAVIDRALYHLGLGVTWMGLGGDWFLARRPLLKLRCRCVVRRAPDRSRCDAGSHHGRFSARRARLSGASRPWPGNGPARRSRSRSSSSSGVGGGVTSSYRLRAVAFGDVLRLNCLDEQFAAAAVGDRYLDSVACADFPVRFRARAVHADLAAEAGVPCRRPCLADARHVEPYVKADARRLASIRRHTTTRGYAPNPRRALAGTPSPRAALAGPRCARPGTTAGMLVVPFADHVVLRPHIVECARSPRVVSRAPARSPCGAGFRRGLPACGPAVRGRR